MYFKRDKDPAPTRHNTMHSNDNIERIGNGKDPEIVYVASTAVF